MITFFTTLKPHRGHIAVIQCNAIRSWLASCPGCQVLLMGSDPGVTELASELGVEHVPMIARNRYGTPLLNGLFGQAEAVSEHRVLCYVNADILLMSDFTRAVGGLIRRRRFLLSGRRWDYDQTEPLTVQAGWEDELRRAVSERGRLQGPMMIDYFAFTRGLWGRLPPFAIGRTAWDNWLIFKAHQLHVPVIDATDQVLAVHQNHDYAHATPGGDREARRGYRWIWRGPEAKLNYLLAGGKKHLYTIWDSTHVLTRDGLILRQQCGLGGGIWSYRRSTRGRI